MQHDQHWLSRYHRQSSSSYGREAGWSETKGTTHLTLTGALVAIGIVAVIAVSALVVIYG